MAAKWVGGRKIKFFIFPGWSIGQHGKINRIGFSGLFRTRPAPIIDACDVGRVWDADVPEDMCAVVAAEPAMGSDHSRGMNIYVRVDVHQQKVTPSKT